jgi:hypothetical protein
MRKSAALCAPSVLAELEVISTAILKQLQATPSHFSYPDKPERLRNEIDPVAECVYWELRSILHPSKSSARSCPFQFHAT